LKTEFTEFNPQRCRQGLTVVSQRFDTFTPGPYFFGGHRVCTDDAYNETLAVLSYAGVGVAGSDGTVTVSVRPHNCLRSRTCRFISDTKLVNRCEALIFSDMTPTRHYPAHRQPNQKWILRTMEV